MQHISFQKASIDYSETQVCADIENARATVFFIQDYISNLVNPAQVQTVELGQALDMVYDILKTANLRIEAFVSQRGNGAG